LGLTCPLLKHPGHLASNTVARPSIDRKPVPDLVSNPGQMEIACQDNKQDPHTRKQLMLGDDLPQSPPEHVLVQAQQNRLNKLIECARTLRGPGVEPYGLDS